MREFPSVASFVEFLETRRAVIPIEQRLGTHAAGEVLVHEAQATIGTYQGGAGPFPAWPELSEATLYGGFTIAGVPYQGKVELGYAPPDNPLLRTGQMRGSIEASTSQDAVVVGSHDPVAYDQEHGTPTIPPRPFIGLTFVRHGHEAACLVYKFVIAALTGNPRPEPPKAGFSGE